jgi:hypothetical protein
MRFWTKRGGAYKFTWQGGYIGFGKVLESVSERELSLCLPRVETETLSLGTAWSLWRGGEEELA